MEKSVRFNATYDRNEINKAAAVICGSGTGQDPCCIIIWGSDVAAVSRGAGAGSCTGTIAHQSQHTTVGYGSANLLGDQTANVLFNSDLCIISKVTLTDLTPKKSCGVTAIDPPDLCVQAGSGTDITTIGVNAAPGACDCNQSAPDCSHN